MNILSVIPNDLGAVITAKGVDHSFSTSYHWSKHHQNIYDPHNQGYWLGNGWETLNDAIAYIMGLN